MALPSDESGKDEFLAVLGHELRNPLGPVRNAVHILRGRAGGDAQSAWALDLIERQLDELIVVIEAISDVSRISRGVMKISAAPFAIGAVVERAVDASAPLLGRKQQQCAVTIAQNEARAEGDAARIEQALRALIRCASKSLPSGATIVVDARVTGDRWGTRIGPVHDPAGGSSSPPRESLLGFFLARSLAAVLGGALAIVASGDRGSFYELVLPLRPAA
jgi:signal transduction histidine kinase